MEIRLSSSGRHVFCVALVGFGLGMGINFSAFAAPVPGGSLDPLTIPKYVIPLVIPPEMPKSTASPAPAADYDIAVRQFKQQILPGGIWGGTLPATTVWSYGRAQDPLPDSSGIGGGAAGVAPAQNSSFNYPAFTVENTTNVPTRVRWINDLKDPATGNFLPHLFNVDQGIHWANPPTANCSMGAPNRTDCETQVGAPYTGPVPLVTHLHGAHVQPHSDGYPEAWWLPAAGNIPAGYSMRGARYGQANNANSVAGSAFYSYENSQSATTLWYHDHALGMTRLNVYAGPAGFWLIRGGSHGDANVDDGVTVAPSDGILPGPAPSGAGDPNFDAAYRNTIREIPVAIQDRSFNLDGSLFYPADRTFFDGFTGPFIGNAGFTGPYNPGPPPLGPSDIPGIWNPEAFFNTMVVNGTTWPMFEVANARYRLRLLNGCNSRTLNLSLFFVTGVGGDGILGTADDVLGAEVPIYQIGAEQGFLPQVVKIVTGFATQLPGDGTTPVAVAAPHPTQALLMGPAERADVIVDFKGLTTGTRIRMINTAPDAPFGGFPDVAADPSTTGQVMDFVVNTTLETAFDLTTTPPVNLVLPADPPLGAATVTRQVSLNELSSDQVCVEVNAITGAIVGTLFSTTPGDPNFQANCAAAAVGGGNAAVPMGPREAVLGVVTTDGLGNLVPVPMHWGDASTETPLLNSTETWEIFNTTADAHPIHLHLVSFEVVNRQALDGVALAAGNLVPTGATIPPNPNETGFKDTVLTFPGQVTRIKAKFDIAGLYVWHCHIVEHEDNEMMRPLVVTSPLSSILWRNANTGANAGWQMNGTTMTGSAYLTPLNDPNWKIVGTGDFDGDGKSDILWRNTFDGSNSVWYMNGTTSTGSAILTPIADQNWTIVGTGDFNGDAKTDILWRNTLNGKNAVWYMNGTTMTGSAYLPTVTDQNWTIVGRGDFNADGRPDIIWRNILNGKNAVWYMNGIKLITSEYLPTVADQNWKIVGTGDFNADAKLDILWRNISTGQNSYWYMDGTRRTGSASIKPLNDPNWEIVGVQ